MSIVRQSPGNRRRWHAVLGGLLVTLMLACPLLCRAGTCCSGHSEAATTETLDEGACPHCQQAEQEQRSQVPPLSPRNPLSQSQCLCSGATVPVVVSAPQQHETSRHLAAGGWGSVRLSGADVREDRVDSARYVLSGRSLCVSHGVLIC
jgi:hypothetical protein